MKTQEKRYKFPSKLGGNFTVVIVETDKTDASWVKIRCINPDWCTYIFWTSRQNLTEITGA